jgi:hypothetical protein
MLAQNCASPAHRVSDGRARSFEQLGRRLKVLVTPNGKPPQVRAAIVIVVMPTASGRKWRASLDGATLCVSASPLIASARILLARSFDPSTTIEMWHANSDAWSLRGKLGAVAATLIDGETAKHPATNGPPVAPPLRAATHDRNRPCRRLVEVTAP